MTTQQFLAEYDGQKNDPKSLKTYKKDGKLVTVLIDENTGRILQTIGVEDYPRADDVPGAQ